MVDAAVTDWVSALANVGVAVAAGVAAAQGVKSLTAWRQETLGRRRIELAEEVLAAVYEAKEILEWIRSPASFAAESEGREGREEEDEDVRRQRDTYYPHIKRISDNAEFFARVRAQRYRVIATFGQEATRSHDVIWDVRARVLSAAQTLMRMRMNAPGVAMTEFQIERAYEARSRLEAVVWAGLDDDRITHELDEMVSATEARFRPEIIGR